MTNAEIAAQRETVLTNNTCGCNDLWRTRQGVSSYGLARGYV